MQVHIVIIGAGPGGYVSAIRAAQLGARVTVIEEAEVGGTCLNKGCIPTKTLITSAQMLNHFRNASDYGIDLPAEVGYNLARVRERKDKVVQTQVKGIRSLFKSRAIELVEGRAVIVAPGVVRVEKNGGTGIDVNADRIILATGSRPAAIPGLAFDGQTILSSDDAVALRSMPSSLLIIGAGVIGSEFAFIYRSFGAEVTVVEMLPRALATEDAEIAAIVEREMKKAGIKLITGTALQNVERSSSGLLTARLSNGKELTVAQVLVSIGRNMNTQGIGLDATGVLTGPRGEIVVNDRMETSVPGIFAIGDVTGKLLLAHVASRQGIVAAENAAGRSSSMDYSAVPSGIFTMPEIGSVGLREHQVVEQGIQHRIGRFLYRALGKAHTMGEIAGMVKIIADAENDKVLGVHICGAHATDLVHEGALAIRAGITVKDLGSMIHAHPTLSEAVMEASEDVHRLAIHVPKQKD